MVVSVRGLIRLALILCYSGGAGLGFQIAKGFFDTIPVAIDEAALIDGCTRWQIFWIFVGIRITQQLE